MNQRGSVITKNHSYRVELIVIGIILVVISLTWIPITVSSFLLTCPIKQQSFWKRTTAVRYFSRKLQLSVSKDKRYKSKSKSKSISEEELKRQLTEYLAKRNEVNADKVAEEIKGKVVGGTRGNTILDFVSGAPVKERVIERAPDVFDYDELSKYGYSNLVSPIMGLVGGRRAVYEMMGMEAPPLLGPPPKKTARKLKFDRTGEDDNARYTGLKMGQVLDDSTMGEALERANKKAKQGKELRPKLMEENYVQPFADKRNTGPRQTPDWTPEKLDEFAVQQGRAQAWSRRSQLGEFVKDPFETLDLSLEVRIYAVSTAFLFAFAFGRATPEFLDMIGTVNGESFIEILKIPGLALVGANVGSSLLCAVKLAPERNRNAFKWGIKGLSGGLFIIQQLRGLDQLITREEKETTSVKRQTKTQP